MEREVVEAMKKETTKSITFYFISWFSFVLNFILRTAANEDFLFIFINK